MSDRLTLSCYLRGFHSLRMVSFWEKLLKLFPLSRLSPRPAYLRVLAIELSEPAIFERALEPPLATDAIVELSREFQHEDGAFQLDCDWDLMQETEQGWKLAPAPVTLWCYAAQFDNELGDNLRIDLGLEQLFLPTPGNDASARAAQANLRSLMRLVADIEANLPVEKRLLWSESGQNFAERLERLVNPGPGIH